MAVTEGTPRRQPARESAARTYPRALPIVPVRARGLTIEGADGRRYLDCLSGAGTLPLGHNHPVVLEAVRKVLDSGAPLNVPDLETPVEDAFVTELVRTLPPGLAERARVQVCGPAATDAVETACALVRAATGRTDILALTNGQQALTPGALCSAEAAENPGDARAIRGACPPFPQDHRLPFDVSGPHGTEHAARWIRALLDDPSSGAPSPAGMLLDPVQDEGGLIPAPDAWIRAVREITTARSIPLIVDEVQTGVGRTGAFWAVEHSGVTPDVMILSEAIGGSLPLAVVVYRDDLAGRQPGAHTGPFRGNQLAMAAGMATLAHVREHRLAERAATLGSRMLSQLRGLAEEFPCIREVRGRGLMIGLELVTSAASDAAASTSPGPTHDPRQAAPELAAAVQRECLRRGLIVGLGGRRTSVVRLLPPLTISDEQASAVLERLSDALTAASCGSTRHHLGDPTPHAHHPLHSHPDHAEQAR
ncbi:aminotransferase class III-fold pyridoxal phosphate-dependent enzyme [Streptomyces sp. KR55]|uniref:aminotransferase class III-fold pyridoxal phosphate-dependent enzyme n=1 Tax=Streptomyces sp. KR55 TaxID=3457425 RepID=UPI003FD5E8E2